MRSTPFQKTGAARSTHEAQSRNGHGFAHVDFVDLGGHNKNRSAMIAGPAIELP